MKNDRKGKPGRHERNNTICSSIAFEGTRGNCQLSTEKAIEITRPIVEKGAYYLVVKEENNVMGWILIGKIRTIFLMKTRFYI